MIKIVWSLKSGVWSQNEEHLLLLPDAGLQTPDLFL